MPARDGRSRATLATVDFDPSLRSSLVHLPMVLYAPLLERGVAPQSIVVELMRDDDAIYVGWSGMSAAPLSASSGAFSSTSQADASSVISLSTALASTFEPPLQSGTQVRITLLRSPPLPTASRIDVTPLTPDDWEVLSLNADDVETNMLSQVRAAKTGMTIAVHVGRQGRTVCRFKVESCTPPTQDVRSPSESDSSLARAVRLSTDTEVVIAPRTRAMEDAAAQAAAAEEHDISASVTKGKHSASSPFLASQLLSRRLYRVLPVSFLDRKAATSAVMLSMEDAEILSTAFGGSSRDGGRCTITKMPCPSAPDVAREKLGPSTSQGKQRSQKEDAQNSQSSDKASSSREGQQPQQQQLQSPARATLSSFFAAVPSEALQGRERLPKRHVWLSPQAREEMRVQDWDLVRFSSPSPTGSATRPQQKAQDEEKEETDEQEGNLAGVGDIVTRCTTIVESTMRARALEKVRMAMGESTRNANVACTGLLLTGGPGSGKTSVAKLLSRQLSRSSMLVSPLYIDCTPHAEERLPVLRDLFSQWFNAAAWHGPTLLVLDNIDRIIPAEVEHVDSPRARQLAEAFVARARLVMREHQVIVLCTAQSNVSLHPLLVSSHILSETVQLKPPSKEARREIIVHLIEKKTHNGTLRQQDLNHVMLATQSEGYLPADLKDLVERAVHEAAIRSTQELAGSTSASGQTQTQNSATTLDLTMADFHSAQEGFTPLSLRDVKLEKSTVAWSDIGGLHETRRVLRETLEWPTKYAAIFASCPLRLRSGLLLYGYPGCGKTLLASAVAKECGLNFISVKGPEILNKYIGASEKSVRDLFDRAQAAKPCVLFFDEFDSIAPKRGHDSTGVTDRVVNQLLTQMDGAEGLDGVYVLAATSRPDLIDSALLRPGRLDKSLLCDMPSEQDRVDIMRAVSSKVHLDESVNLEAWSQRTEGFSGADLQALLYNAHLETIHESIAAAGQTPDTNGPTSTNGSNDSDKDKKRDVKFISFGGSTGSKKTTLSGAERQALQRRIELMLSNDAASLAAKRKASSGLNGHDLDASTQAAARAATKERAKVKDEHLERSLKATRPSVPKEEQMRLRRIYSEFAGERDGSFPNGEGSREVGARESLM